MTQKGGSVCRGNEKGTSMSYMGIWDAWYKVRV